MEQDPWDTRYLIAVWKGIVTDLILVFTFVTVYVLYNLTVKEMIVLPVQVLSNQFFLVNNFILLLVLITYFIYKSREII